MIGIKGIQPKSPKPITKIIINFIYGFSHVKRIKYLYVSKKYCNIFVINDFVFWFIRK